MLFKISEEIKNQSGIYKINVEGGSSVYIGSATNLKRRFDLHISQLRNGIHHCIALQRAFIKYGEEAFSFEILELCESETLIEHEQAWIDKTENLYNSCKVAGSRKGVKESEETKALKSKVRTGVPRSDNTSGFVGVALDKRTGRWFANITIRKKTTYLGTYDTPEEANEAYQTYLKNPSQKIKISKPRYKNNSSGFKGVYPRKGTNRWRAKVSIEGREISIGSFSSAEEANEARLKFLAENGL